MVERSKEIKEKVVRRTLGVHLTSKEIFNDTIFPEIYENLTDYIWVDLYCGKGNLILPVLDSIPKDSRIKFFKKHIFLFDIQEEMVERCIENAETYGIPFSLAKNNIKQRDNLASFPNNLKAKGLPIFHITNPPYLYLGYIRKHRETQKHSKLFEGSNKGYQDLYQIAMINDLRSGIENLIYIIPSNFLFGASVSNKFRSDFLKYYNICKMIIFETKIFEYTGTNICIGFFKRKQVSKSEIIEFNGLKIKKKKEEIKKKYILKPEYKYRAGSEFDEFLEKNQVKTPLNVNYYLLKKEVINNIGNNRVSVIDANNYKNNQYIKLDLEVNDKLKNKIESNILYVRTIDTGSRVGRAGLGIINEDLKVNGIYVSGNTYRTHPIQIFLEPIITQQDQILLKNYLNFVLERFREKLDSEFLTTYKYSNADYTRKYLGLTQVRSLIETLPIINMDSERKIVLNDLVTKEKFDEILLFLKKFKKKEDDYS